MCCAARVTIINKNTVSIVKQEIEKKLTQDFNERKNANWWNR